MQFQELRSLGTREAGQVKRLNAEPAYQTNRDVSWHTLKGKREAQTNRGVGMANQKGRGPIKWTLLGIQICALVAIAAFTAHVSGLGLEQFKLVSWTAGLGGLGASLGAALQARRFDDEEMQQRGLERSLVQASSSIPWYAAPVVWIPAVMLLTVWFFR